MCAVYVTFRKCAVNGLIKKINYTTKTIEKTIGESRRIKSLPDYFMKNKYSINFVSFYRECEDGDVWYYSTPLQFEELMSSLDKNEMEVALYRELSDYKDEIVRQMELTETITNQIKGNKKSYLEVENGNYTQSILHRTPHSIKNQFIIHPKLVTKKSFFFNLKIKTQFFPTPQN